MKSETRKTSLSALMARDPVILDEDATVEDALRLNERYPFRHFPVATCNRVVGMVTDRDLRLATALWPERAQERARREPERVGAIMRRPVHTLPPDASPAQAAKDMVSLRIGAIPVVDGTMLVGIVTETDLLAAFLEMCRAPGATCDDRVANHMHQPPPTVGGDARLADALQLLDGHLAHLCVVDDGQLVGFVSERDLFAGLARERIQGARGEAEGRPREARLRVRDVMAEDVLAVAPETRLGESAAAMLAHRISALPVIPGGAGPARAPAGREPVGLLTQRHVLAHFAALDSERRDT